MLSSSICVILLLTIGCSQASQIYFLKGKVAPKNSNDYNTVLTNTVLKVQIEDVSLADAPSVVISQQIIQLGPSQRFPIDFSIVYPKELIESSPDRVFALSARIESTASDLLFINDERIDVPDFENLGNTVTIGLIKIQVPDKNLCNMDKDSGMCLAYFEMYYYDTVSKSCKMFVYGGCGGNLNRFESLEQCQRACGSNQDGKTDTLDPEDSDESESESESESDETDAVREVICNLPAEQGPCKGYFERWYYDSAKKACEKFVYGGCQGNANNFVQEGDCIKQCSSE